MHTRKPRSAKPRFAAGDKVQVTKAIRFPGFQGATGAVIDVKENHHAITLDEYIIRFPDNQEQVFWDIELNKSETKIAESG
jgi:hypothetical protein